MKIGLIAMSGVRAWSEELNRAGLTMPGVMERGAVIASLPSLSLLTLAALTPDEVSVEYHEIRDLKAAGVLPGGLPGGFDLVAVSTMSAQAKDAYALADRYRAMGVPTVLGGLHATAVPDEAAEHFDGVVAGEGEPLWARVVEDARRGRLERLYRSRPGEHYDLARAPVPRFDLLEIERYNRLTVQTCRGCPHRCEFCASSILLTPGYQVKPVERIIAELRAIKALWDRPFIELADDNSFASRGHARRLLAAMASEKVSWFTEADISIADDPVMLRLMRDSGCRQVLIGLESPVREGLDGLEMRRNWKLRQLDRYEAAVRTIQSFGITVNGCFILGLDGQTPETFERVHDFIDRTALYETQLTVLTPFPGTPLYDRLLREGRILHPGAWERCTLFDVNFVPRGMTVRELEEGFLGLARRVHDPAFLEDRRKRFFGGVRYRPGRDVRAA